ncbi:MAG TPA: hypothetical protein VGN80_17165 [Devosiaceae bacterium]|jgi:hypothetical protein|nr:hypothetical protein [Devosiaceae bacterium]
MSKTLTDRAEIRQWAEARNGSPMLMEVPSGTDSRTLLQITFGQHALNAEHNEGPDRVAGGYELVTWDDWLAELERQQLALKVNDEEPGRLDNDFRFVSRDETGNTTDAAQQPPVATVEDPEAQAAVNRGERG